MDREVSVVNRVRKDQLVPQEDQVSQVAMD